jgi:hypothetical protein
MNNHSIGVQLRTISAYRGGKSSWNPFDPVNEGILDFLYHRPLLHIVCTSAIG